MNPYDNDKAFVFLEKLKEDSYEYRGLKTDSLGVEEKRAAIRSLMNIRTGCLNSAESISFP